jgi:hypothetical protein
MWPLQRTLGRCGGCQSQHPTPEASLSSMFAASLRHRNQRLQAGMSKEYHRSAVPNCNKHSTAQPPPPPPPPPPRPREFRFRLAISIFLLVAFTVYQQSQSTQGKKRLPDVYGICSKDGRESIYTSEEETPAVECVVIDGKRIADLGSLCEWVFRCSQPLRTLKLIDILWDKSSSC